MNINEKISDLIKDNSICLFMKERLKILNVDFLCYGKYFKTFKS